MSAHKTALLGAVTGALPPEYPIRADARVRHAYLGALPSLEQP